MLLSISQCTGQSPTRKNYIVPNVEKLCCSPLTGARLEIPGSKILEVKVYGNEPFLCFKILLFQEFQGKQA